MLLSLRGALAVLEHTQPIMPSLRIAGGRAEASRSRPGNVERCRRRRGRSVDRSARRRSVSSGHGTRKARPQRKRSVMAARSSPVTVTLQSFTTKRSAAPMDRSGATDGLNQGHAAPSATPVRTAVDGRCCGSNPEITWRTRPARTRRVHAVATTDARRARLMPPEVMRWASLSQD